MSRSETSHSPVDYRPGPHWMALLATVFTWPLLFVGGLVTTFRVGMAVPDWPTTFGINMFLFDMWNAAWGVFIEHGHRLYGAAVGMFVILLMLDFLVFGKGWKIKALGVAALLAVIAQGVLGGVRVRLNSTLLAAVHGCTAQLFFAYMVLLCLLTGRGLRSVPTVIERAGKQKFRAFWTLGLIYLQVVAGAWLRHFPNTNGLVIHAVLAVAVAAHVVALVIRTERNRLQLASLVPSARVMAGTLLVQATLGIAAWWLLRPFDGIPREVTNLQALIRTGHQANAALLLAAAVVYAVRSAAQYVSVPDESAANEPVLPSSRVREALA